MRKDKLTIAALALSAVACGDSVTAPTREIRLNLCGVRWAAYRNEGEPWTSLPAAETEVTFTATERLAIATVSNAGGPSSFSPQLDIHYLTAEQAEAAFVCGGLVSGTPSGKRLNGSVAGVSVGNTVVISTGRGLASASATSPTFQVRAAEDGPTDIVAVSRLPPANAPPAGRADKIIIRRGEDHADGATMPVLDFSSPEAFAPQSNTLTIEGMSAGTTLSAQTHIKTQRGASLNLRYDFDQPSAVATTYSLPASRLADGDVHQVLVHTTDKSMWFFYRSPTDRTLALGPAASRPTFTQPTTASDHVVRVDVASQPEYGSQISIVLSVPQPATSSNTVAIRATREYFGGTPATWSLVLPDLTGVPGFSPLWGPSLGGNGWTLTVSGAPFLFTPASGRDGDVYRSATAFGFITIGQ